MGADVVYRDKKTCRLERTPRFVAIDDKTGGKVSARVRARRSQSSNVAFATQLPGVG